MLRIMLVAAAITTVLSFAPRSASAAEMPWCALIAVGEDGMYEDCRYRTIEECVPNVIAGNRGYCNHNPRYVGGDTPSKARKKRHTERR